MSFGRRLALFFLLIAIVPTAALVAIILFVSFDSQRGKVDEGLASAARVVLRAYPAPQAMKPATEQYAAEVKRATGDEAVVFIGNRAMASTVTDPPSPLDSTGSRTVDAGGTSFRAGQVDLGPDERLMLLRKPSGGLLGIGGPSVAILVWFLVAAVVLAWALARTLTRLHQRVAEQAVTDSATGLWNRRHLAETLEREVARAKRFDEPVALVLVDIDKFKQINDKYGHLQGDAVLEHVADGLRREARSIDVAFRYGGDELGLVLIETDREQAMAVANALRAWLDENPVPLGGGGSLAVSLSIGVATVPGDADDVGELFDAVDQALLMGKRKGRGRTEVAPSRASNAR